MEDLKERIAGEIALSDSPGSAMKKWRELFGISQVELAKSIRITTSTISDYESNRRLSPGVGVIKRFIEALFTIDESRGSNVIRGLANMSMEKPDPNVPFYNIKDFSTPLSGDISSMTLRLSIVV